MIPDAITTAIQAAIDDAFERGRAAGYDEARQQVYLAVAAVVPPTTFLDNKPTTPAATASPIRAVGKRAPKGLTSHILSAIFADGRAVSMEDAQKEAVERDSRVSDKTVYNELYKRDLYERRADGLWWMPSSVSGAPADNDQDNGDEEEAGVMLHAVR